jgi:hypothetical protein
MLLRPSAHRQQKTPLSIGPAGSWQIRWGWRPQKFRILDPEANAFRVDRQLQRYLLNRVLPKQLPRKALLVFQ